MKKKITRPVSMLLVLAMLTVLTACGQNTDTTNTTNTATANTTAAANATDSTTTTEPAEVVQIDVFSASTASTTAAGVYDNTWWGKILIEKVGVSLNVLPTGDQAAQKLQALMASGSLPDIVIFNSTKDVQNAIRGDMLVNLDEHLDALPNVALNATETLQFYRDNVSNDTGKAYAVPTSGIGPADLGAEPNWGPYLRWDLYTEIGSPVIDTYEDYLTVLADMQTLKPTTEDGKKTYGLTLWKDWDNYSMFMATEIGPTLGIDCGDQLGQLPFLQVDFNTGETSGTLDPDSAYIQALKFYYDANQMGLLDPDSLTQTYDTAKSKITEGRVFFSWWSWLNDAYNTTENVNAESPTGFAAVLPENTKTLISSTTAIGKQWPIAISSATKNLDVCLKYVDFMFSTAGLQLLYNGPEGVTWDLDSSGKPELTTEGWEYINDPTLELPDGGALGDGVRILGINALTYAFINPDTNEAIHYQAWESTKQYNIDHQTKLKTDWSSVTGASSTIDYVTSKNMTTEIPLAQALITPMTDEISASAARIGDIVKTNSWQMIFAKDDAEFQSLYDDMVTKAEGLGLNDVYASSLQGWNDALALAQKYE